ncbi:MAG: hypothetical protein ATN31_01235 [Candidatus Epulonipiscioides saccharophilum]|nr:MAG: hypothetical protein ATN31_01235 [Epulopiscium sp. AS2M-Bin001]
MINQFNRNNFSHNPYLHLDQTIAHMSALLDDTNKVSLFASFDWFNQMKTQIDPHDVNQLKEYIVNTLIILQDFIDNELIINLTLELNIIYLRQSDDIIDPILIALNSQIENIYTLDSILLNIDSGLYDGNNTLFNLLSVISLLDIYTMRNIDKMDLIKNKLYQHGIISDIQINLSEILAFIINVENISNVGYIYLLLQTLDNNVLGNLFLETIEEYLFLSDMQKKNLDKNMFINKMIQLQGLNLTHTVSLNDIYLELTNTKLINFENIYTAIKKFHKTKKLQKLVQENNLLEPFKKILNKALLGDKDSQYDVGFGYTHGIGVAKDISEGLKWFKLAAEQGHKNAQYEVGYAYIYEHAVESKYIESDEIMSHLEINEILVNNNFIKPDETMNHLATNNLAEPNKKMNHLATNHLDIADEKNDFNLQSENYLIPNNFNRYKEAAEAGHIGALYKLGRCYEDGIGIETNLSVAITCYTRAAKNGNLRAQTHLATCYEKGIGVDRNLDTAFEWYVRAAVGGYAKAQNNLGYFYEHGKGVDKNYIKAFEWYEKSANQGHAKAQYNLALCYEYGKGVSKNMDEAFVWLKKSAEQGNMFAQYAVGTAYKKGLGVKKDKKLSYIWYNKAAEQGHLDAKSKLNKKIFRYL